MPQPLLVWWPPDCAAAELPGVASACAELQAWTLPEPPVAEGDVDWLPARSVDAMPGEFHRHTTSRGHWRLLRAGCR